MNIAKKLVSIIALVTYLSFWFGVYPVFAATRNDTLDNCDGVETLGDASNCSSGGSGFSANWVAAAGNWNALAVGCQLNNCVLDTAGDNVNGTRAFDADANIAQTYYTQMNNQDTGNSKFIICQSGFTGICDDTDSLSTIVNRRSTFSDVLAVDGSGTVSLGAFTYDAWQKVEFETGTNNSLSGESACVADQIRYSLNDGTWTACRSQSAGNDPAGFDLVKEGSVLITAYFDEISGSEAAAAATATRTPPLWWILRD